MSPIVYFLLWAVLIFLMMRFGCGAHVMGHGHRRHPDRSDHGDSPARAIDPVCGMTVDVATSRTSTHRRRNYYFCSTDCGDKFGAAPDRYADRFDTQPMEAHYGAH